MTTCRNIQNDSGTALHNTQAGTAGKKIKRKLLLSDLDRKLHKTGIEILSCLGYMPLSDTNNNNRAISMILIHSFACAD